MKLVITSLLFIFAFSSWIYFLLSAYKALVEKDRSFLQSTTLMLIISGMLTSLFFLVLRLIN